MESYCSIGAKLVVGPIYLAISAAGPFSDKMMLLQTTASG